jgi:hypothetical protein
MISMVTQIHRHFALSRALHTIWRKWPLIMNTSRPTDLLFWMIFGYNQYICRQYSVRRPSKVCNGWEETSSKNQGIIQKINGKVITAYEGLCQKKKGSIHIFLASKKFCFIVLSIWLAIWIIKCSIWNKYCTFMYFCLMLYFEDF